MKTSIKSQPVYLAQIVGTIYFDQERDSEYFRWCKQASAWLTRTFGPWDWTCGPSSRWYFKSSWESATFVFHNKLDRDLFILAFGEITITVVDIDYDSLSKYLGYQ